MPDENISHLAPPSGPAGSSPKPGFRLLVAGLTWPPETFIERLLRGLLAAGFEVTAACAARPGAEWMNQRGFHWLRTPSWSGPVPFRLGRLAGTTVGGMLRSRADSQTLIRADASGGSFSRRAARWNALLPFAGGRWDALYFPWNEGAIGLRPLFELGIPVVISCRGAHVNIAPHNPARSAIREGLRDTFARAAAVHCVSDAICGEAARYGLEPTKGRVIRPAVEPAFFRPSDHEREPDGRFRLVTTGSLIWRKGYEYALLGLRGLIDRAVPAQLSIIGDGPEKERILYTVKDLGLQPHVNLLGRLPPEKVRDEIQQADVFVLTSLSEGISNAVLEGMACGRAVVTSDCGGMAEAVTDGVEGFVTPVRDGAALTDALETLWRNPGQRAAMGAAGRSRVLRQFDLKDQVAQFQDLFLSLRTG